MKIMKTRQIRHYRQTIQRLLAENETLRNRLKQYEESDFLQIAAETAKTKTRYEALMREAARYKEEYEQLAREQKIRNREGDKNWRNYYLTRKIS